MYYRLSTLKYTPRTTKCLLPHEQIIFLLQNYTDRKSQAVNKLQLSTYTLTTKQVTQNVPHYHQTSSLPQKVNTRVESVQYTHTKVVHHIGHIKIKQINGSNRPQQNQ